STLSKRMAGMSPSSSVMAPVWVSGSMGKALLQSTYEQGGRVARGEEQDAGESDGFDVAEVVAAVQLRGLHHVDDEDDRYERGLLEHRDDVVPQARNGRPNGLGDDHRAPGAATRHRQCRRRFPLSGGDRVDTGPIDLGHVGGVMDAEDHDADD